MPMNFGNLLGLVQSAADPLELDEESQLNQNQIIVEGRESPADPMADYIPNSMNPPFDADGRNMNNQIDIAEARAANEQGQKTADRKGLFGTKGTLRDVLGLVGDAFLIQSGNNPIYTPGRRREQLSDAAAGFTAGPEQAIAAIERMAQIDMGAAKDMYDSFLLNQDRSFDNRLNKAKEERRNTDLGLERFDEVNDYVARRLNAAVKTGRPDSLEEAITDIERYARSNNISMEQIGDLRSMRKEQLAEIAQTGMTPYQQIRTGQMDRGLEIRLRNAKNSEARTQIAREALENARSKEEYRRLLQVLMPYINANARNLYDDDESTGFESQVRSIQGGGGNTSRPSVSNWPGSN